jgi:hypothetical protein
MICRCVAGLTSYVVCVDVVNKDPAPQAYTGRATSNDIVLAQKARMVKFITP